MLEPSNESELAPIPEKKYFAIGEVAKMCKEPTNVLRYWEQEFDHLKPSKRGGKRRYYQYEDILAIRKIRKLLREDGYTISGAKQQLAGGKDKQLDVGEHAQLIRETISEIEDVLKLMKTAGSQRPY